MTNPVAKIDIFNGDYVAIEKAALDIVKNALRRDLKRGLVVRGEILDLIESTIQEIKLPEKEND